MRALLYFLVLIGVQGALSRLLPAAITPPDLFLLTGVALALRWRPTLAVAGGYGVGLIQDVLGHGALGFHAAGVAAGCLLVLGLREFVADTGLLQVVVTVLAAVAGQWAAYLVLSYWLRNDLVTVASLTGVLPIMLAGTLLLAAPVERMATLAFGPRPSSEEGLA